VSAPLEPEVLKTVKGKGKPKAKSKNLKKPGLDLEPTEPVEVLSNKETTTRKKSKKANEQSIGVSKSGSAKRSETKGAKRKTTDQPSNATLPPKSKKRKKLTLDKSKSEMNVVPTPQNGKKSGDSSLNPLFFRLPEKENCSVAGSNLFGNNLISLFSSPPLQSPVL
jgi:ATPase subunit of ABC transporter with duplicated ATPase domains